MEMTRPTKPYPALTAEEVERFESKFVKQNKQSCWVWLAAMAGDYGQICIRKRFLRAHRVSYELYVGKIPDGMIVLHKCDNGRCVNPDHLTVGTYRDNTLDMFSKGRNRNVRELNAAQGEEHGCAKLTEKEVRAMREIYAKGGISQAEVGRRFGISQTLAHLILTRKNWKHI